ncbi:MAG: 30S ribosomal protein S9 [Proteobacteria bacterium]|jgi:small subunit ribosomal protein S9|nr:30S ribosomal protein S9 [Pseudomonadota bacterium]MDA0971184.1 30S ribosomal protein S9 [Pseudomonadota bacterium]MDA0995679.1 30S ribosomal protein S9 [Pseudomonadota bacterium]
MSLDIKITKDAHYATGKRKDAVARVWVLAGSGKISVNGKIYTEYFKRPVHQLLIEKPLNITDKKTSVDILCTVKGGGMSGQAGAVTHGISKALVGSDPAIRKTVKKDKLLTRDSRSVERKKYGQKKARRRFQFSKR